ncbi:unnamed protein product, partial [Nesidiocoris tenuis]
STNNQSPLISSITDSGRLATSTPGIGIGASPLAPAKSLYARTRLSRIRLK